MPAKIPHFFSRMETGTVTADDPAGTFAAVTFSETFTNIPVVVVTDKDDDATSQVQLYITSITKSGFSLVASNPEANRVVNWTAIG